MSSASASNQTLPDFSGGINASQLSDGTMQLGKIGDDEIVIAKSNGGFFAFAAHCTHYGGDLNKGLLVGNTIRCPLHHACFDLKTGNALRAPAFDPIKCWTVEVVEDVLYVRDQILPLQQKLEGYPIHSIVIVGGGAAGVAAAEMLRREGYVGSLTMISSDSYPPCDRPNLSKDFLAGNIPEQWLPVRSEEFYTDSRIDLYLNETVESIDLQNQSVHTNKGKNYAFDKLILATGASPVELYLEGADTATIHYLRSYADCKSIIESTESVKSNAGESKGNVVVVGASFIGLEVAASLRMRGLNVHVVAPEKLPLEQIMGKDIGELIKSVHEKNGVDFHLGCTVKEIDGWEVELSDGNVVDADFIVVGVGVQPETKLAENAGIAVDDGILVNEFFETSEPNVYAVGDAVRWFDKITQSKIHIEHWVSAERMGQMAARNILGNKHAADIVPFFWSQHFDVTINYTGYSGQWDSIDIDGSVKDCNFVASFRKGEQTIATATVGRNLTNLQAELSLEAS